MLIQQWSKRASHFFKDLGYKTQEIASVENEILVKTIDTVKVPSFKFLNMSDSISNNELLGNNYLIQFFLQLVQLFVLPVPQIFEMKFTKSLKMLMI